jgi:Domain of unknown function (DUF5615)
LKLLLDEQISAAVAEQLRRRGHDVVAVTEIELHGSDDETVLARAIDDGRALVTNNIRDFRLIHARHLTQDVAHHGIVFVPSSAYTLRRTGIGALVKALDELLVALPKDDALRDQECFL